MSNLQKMLIVNGDKALCALFLCLVLWSISSSSVKWTAVPEAVVESKKVMDGINKFNAPVPKFEKYTYTEEIEQLNSWKIETFMNDRSIFYKVEEIDIEFLNREYNKKLNAHKHLVYVDPMRVG